MKNPALYFFLLVSSVFFYFTLGAVYKSNRLSKTFSEKSIKFVLCKQDGLVMINPGFMFLPMEVDPILEEQG